MGKKPKTHLVSLFCSDCGKQSRVTRKELARAARLRCTVCGGPMNIGQHVQPEKKRRNKKQDAANFQKFSAQKQLEWFFEMHPEDFPEHELGRTYDFHVSRWRGRETKAGGEMKPLTAGDILTDEDTGEVYMVRGVNPLTVWQMNGSKAILKFPQIPANLYRYDRDCLVTDMPTAAGRTTR
jgi:hypothetical protein